MDLGFKQSQEPSKSSFNFEKWCKDIGKHPVFLNEIQVKAAEPDISPDIEALRAMGSLDEEAEFFKEEGNRFFKNKNYRMAVTSYTQGLNLSCADDRTNSTLHSNRGIANKILENYRSSLKDFELAIKSDPRNEKALLNGAECFLILDKPKECLNWIESHLVIGIQITENATHKLEQLRQRAKYLYLFKEKHSRKSKHECNSNSLFLRNGNRN